MSCNKLWSLIVPGTIEQIFFINTTNGAFETLAVADVEDKFNARAFKYHIPFPEVGLSNCFQN